MKPIGTLLIGAAIAALPLYAQQAQPSVKRHQQEIVHYQVRLEGGDISKITTVNIVFNTQKAVAPDQSGFTNSFGGQCIKSSGAPNVWDCSATIPNNIADGDYRLIEVDIGAGPFSKPYSEEFHVPLIPIENTQTFTPPSKVTVKEQP
jgi:hypothetical protein